MKKYISLLFLSLTLLVVSCGSSDDSKKEPEVVIAGKWEPSTITLVKIVPLQTIAYPHTAGCSKDYLELSNNNSAKFFRYEGSDCKVTEYANAFQRTGNNVTVNVLGYTVKGEIKNETDTYMEVHSDITEYIPLIKAQFPQYEQYLSMLEGGTVQLALNKK